MDEIQTTDVSSTVDSGAGVDTSSAAALSVSTSEQPASAVGAQSPSASDVTAQSSAGEAAQQEISEDILNEFLPKEELEASPDKYAKALLRIQQSHERLWEKHRPLQSLEGFQALAERGTPDVIQQQLERMDSLITPVVDPNTKQPVVDANGYQTFTTLPFIESMETEQQGFAEQLLRDVLNIRQTLPNGQQIELWQRLQLPPEFTLKSVGLDPSRLEDYRNIDALTAQSGQNLSEQLAQIPSEYHELFKSLPPKVRDDFMQRDEEVRNWELNNSLEAFNAKKQQEAQATQQQEAQQRYQMELRASVEREQEADIEQQFSEGLSSIKDDIASKVTFSSDAKQDALMKEIVAGILLPLRDPSNHVHMKPLLEALGVQLDSAFTENLSAYSEARRNWKLLELSNRKVQANAELGKAAGPRARVMTKAADIGMKIAQALGGQMKAKAEARNGQLKEASQIRPTVSGQVPNGNMSVYEEVVAAGINPNDTRAVDSYLLQRSRAAQSVAEVRA